MILAGLIAARFTHYLALMVLLGATTFTVFASSKARAAPVEGGMAVRARLRRTLFWSGLATLITAVLVLGFTAANMAGTLSGMVDLATLRTIVVDTDFGRVWSFRLLAAAALTGWFAARRKADRAPAADWSVVVVAGALTMTVALTGHAQIETGAAGLVHRIGDATHLAAAAVWLGALPPFLLLLKRSAAAHRDEAVRVGRLLERFHVIGQLAVGILLVSGLINSWFLVGDVGKLPITRYGQLLLVKLALFSIMVALAADNRLRLVPQLNQALADGLPPEAWLARLRSHVRLEFMLGIGVLLVVAVLGAIAPADEAAGA